MPKAKRKEPTPAEFEAELAKLDLRSPEQARKRFDGLLRNLLNRPPDPYTPKPKRRRVKASKPAK